MPFLRHSYLLPTDREDAATTALWEAGTLGCEVREEGGGRMRIDAYFPPGTADPLAGRSGVELLASEELADRDWLAPWRRRARPFDLGASFRVDPREPGAAGTEASGTAETVEGGAGRRLLHLPARAAFGVGSHPSTRLAVELIEGLPLEGATVVDVGTGTGVLAFAALHLGARRALAFDSDTAAAVAARDNARRNGFAPHLFAGTADALRPAGRFDWGLINVVPERILPFLPGIAARVRRGLILSGILAERGDGVAATAAELGFGETGRLEHEEWVALRVERAETALQGAP